MSKCMKHIIGISKILGYIQITNSSSNLKNNNKQKTKNRGSQAKTLKHNAKLSDLCSGHSLNDCFLVFGCWENKKAKKPNKRNKNSTQQKTQQHKPNTEHQAHINTIRLCPEHRSETGVVGVVASLVFVLSRYVYTLSISNKSLLPPSIESIQQTKM